MKFGKGKKDKKKNLEMIPEVTQEENVIDTENAELQSDVDMSVAEEIVEEVTQEAVEEVVEEVVDTVTEESVEEAVAVEESATEEIVTEEPVMESAEYVEAAMEESTEYAEAAVEESVESDSVALDETVAGEVSSDYTETMASEETEAVAEESVSGKKKDKVKKEKIKKEKVKKQKEGKPVEEGEVKNDGKVSMLQSIMVKLIGGFLLPVICVIILGFVSYQKAADVVVANFEDSAVQTVFTIERYLDLITDTIQSRYAGYMNNQEITDYFSGQYDIGVPEGEVSAEKERIRKLYTTEVNDNVNGDALIEDMMFISDKHTSFGTTTVTEGAYEAYMATDNGKRIADKPYKYYWVGNNCEADELIGAKGDFYAMRLVRKVDNAPALMMIDIDIEVVIEALDALDPGDGGFVALVTSDGAEVFSTHNRTEAKTIFSNQKFYADAMAGEEIEGKKYVTYDGEDYVFLYRKVGELDMMICGLIAEDYLVNKVNDILIVTIILVVIASVVAVAIGTFLANGISKTIKTIVKKLKKVAEGDFTVTVHTKRKDEFKLVTGAVNETVSQVKELIASVQDVNEELVKAADRVYSSSALFMETTQNIESSVDEIKTGAYKLDEDSDNCLVQMDKLSEKIETVTSNTEEISKVVDTTNESIVAGIGSIEGVTESTEATTRITGHVIEAIEGLQEKSRSIGNIVQVINDIAEQTNLLSLNASIEAARAGEAGRGFAVVASEISKLADQSLGSADQIRKIIEEILGNTGKVVDIAKEAFEIVQEQNKSVAGTTEAFEEMKENIGILLQSLEEITQNVINMEGARAMTLESIENISAVSAETAACSVSVAETVESQNKAIYDLDTAANTLSNKSAQLTELLKRFTV